MLHIRRKLIQIVLFICLILFNISPIFAQLSITAEDSALVIDFSGFTGSGFSPSPSAGQLNSNYWAGAGMSDGDLNYDSTEATGDWARGIRSDAVGTGGLYAFDNGQGDTLLLIQPIDADWTPGTLDLRLRNDTGSPVTSLRIEYHLMVRNDQERANSFNFSYSVDSLIYTNVSSLDYVSTEVSQESTLVEEGIKTAVISDLDIADGSVFFFRWSGDDVSGSNNRDEFLLDDIKITINPANQPPGSFILLSPPDSSRFITSPTSTDTIDMIWSISIDPDGDELEYYVQFDTSLAFDSEIGIQQEQILFFTEVYVEWIHY